MRNAAGGAAAVLAVMLAIPAAAQERDYCSTRPSLGQSACVLEAGRFAVETGLADWERDDAGDMRVDRIAIGDTLVRIGVTDHAELQIGWTPFGTVREADRAGGTVRRFDRVGDASIGARVALHNPDGSGFSWGLQPTVTLPVGRTPVGEGDWGAELVVPASIDLNDGLQLQFSPSVAAAVDADGHGRHLAYGNIVGLELAASDAVHVTLEGAVLRDDDPSGAATQAFTALAAAFTASDDLQFDVGGVAGLNADSPDLRLYAGISRRF